jgi:hypothetical protein
MPSNVGAPDIVFRVNIVASIAVAAAPDDTVCRE